MGQQKKQKKEEGTVDLNLSGAYQFMARTGITPGVLSSAARQGDRKK